MKEQKRKLKIEKGNRVEVTVAILMKKKYVSY